VNTILKGLPQPEFAALRERLHEFWAARIEPAEDAHGHQLLSAPDRWQPVPLVEELKRAARSLGLWNLFSPNPEHGPGLSNAQYAQLVELMGRVHWSSEVFNCSPPDTGNMEILDRYGTPSQKSEWLEPLLAGEIRSAFCMSEPGVASSDATNIATRIVPDGDEYVITGRKWWASGAPHSKCRILIVMGKTFEDAERHRQQTQILVPIDTAGVEVVRVLDLFGFDDAPHGHAEIEFHDVRVPAENVLLGPGRGFEIAQGRLGPGRIHHCMRIIGQAERALEATCRRLNQRVAFGKPLSAQSVWLERVAESRIMIDQARLLTVHAAEVMDQRGNKAARREIAMAKVAAPNMLDKVLDWAIQAHGAAGVTSDTGLGYAYARARVMRIVDGPDEVHRNQIGRLELARYPAEDHAAPGR
jgi:acyl-CoA dehydrogenase